MREEELIYSFQKKTHDNIIMEQSLSTTATDTNFWSSLTQDINRGAYPQADGWIKIENNVQPETVSFINLFTRPSALFDMKPNTQYTLFYEVRNKNIDFNQCNISFSDGTNDLWTESFSTNNIRDNLQEDTIYSRLITTESDLSVKTFAFRTFIWYDETGGTFDFELRIWLVEGDYTLNPRPFKMYSYKWSKYNHCKKWEDGIYEVAAKDRYNQVSTEDIEITNNEEAYVAAPIITSGTYVPETWTSQNVIVNIISTEDIYMSSNAGVTWVKLEEV